MLFLICVNTGVNETILILSNLNKVDFSHGEKRGRVFLSLNMEKYMYAFTIYYSTRLSMISKRVEILPTELDFRFLDMASRKNEAVLFRNLKNNNRNST